LGGISRRYLGRHEITFAFPTMGTKGNVPPNTVGKASTVLGKWFATLLPGKRRYAIGHGTITVLAAGTFGSILFFDYLTTRAAISDRTNAFLYHMTRLHAGLEVVGISRNESGYSIVETLQIGNQVQMRVVRFPHVICAYRECTGTQKQ